MSETPTIHTIDMGAIGLHKCNAANYSAATTRRASALATSATGAY